LTTTLSGYLTPSSSSGYLTPQLIQLKVDSDSKASTILPVFMGKVEFGILNPMTTNYGFTLENVSGTTTFTSYNNGSLPIQFIGQLKNYKNSAYENVLTTSDLSTYITSSSLTSTLLNYITSSSLTSTLLNYITSSSLTSTLASYVTNSSLTSTLSSYVTSSSLTTTLAGYASKSLANTYTALQTFSSGITATTQVAGDNSTNVATTAYVNQYTSVNLIINSTTQVYTIPAQTTMKVYYQHSFTGGGGTINLTDPTNAYIGQTITVHNKGSSFSMAVKCATTGSTGVGQSSSNFQTSSIFDTSTSNICPNNVIKTFMFLGSTATPRWIVLGC
jgi:hypothetical protein